MSKSKKLDPRWPYGKCERCKDQDNAGPAFARVVEASEGTDLIICTKCVREGDIITHVLPKFEDPTAKVFKDYEPDRAHRISVLNKLVNLRKQKGSKDGSIVDAMSLEGRTFSGKVMELWDREDDPLTKLLRAIEGNPGVRVMSVDEMIATLRNED